MSHQLDPNLHPDTLTIGYGYDPATALGSAKPPLYMSTTFVYESAAQAKAVHQAFFDGDGVAADDTEAAKDWLH